MKNKKDEKENNKDKKKQPVLINDSFIYDIELSKTESRQIIDSKLDIDKRNIIHERI